MKKLIYFLTVLMAISCNQNEEPPVQKDRLEEYGITQDVITSLRIQSVKIYKKGEKEHSKLAKQFASEINAAMNPEGARTQFLYTPPTVGEQNIANIMQVVILAPYGTIGNSAGSTVWFAQTGNTSDEYYTSIHPYDNQPSKVLWTKLNPRPNHTPTQPPFNPVMYSYPGRIQFTQQNGLGVFNDNLRWWQCVQSEFGKMCLANPLRELMCAAAGAYAPELMLVAYGAWMLSCI